MSTLEKKTSIIGRKSTSDLTLELVVRNHHSYAAFSMLMCLHVHVCPLSAFNIFMLLDSLRIPTFWIFLKFTSEDSCAAVLMWRYF